MRVTRPLALARRSTLVLWIDGLSRLTLTSLSKFRTTCYRDRVSAAARPIVLFETVSFAVGGRRILHEIELDVREGETVVLLGRSGSGKTTTLRLVNRLLDPTSGTVLVEGRSTRDWDPIRLRRGIGYVIQETGLFPHFTVAENVALVPRLEGWTEARQKARVRELLELVNLDPEEHASRLPEDLSGGQRQRVGIARALAADPRLLLMDEPFGALDPLTRSELQRELKSLARRLGKTILLVTHDVREALLLATRIALFREGRLVVLATPAEIRSASDPEARAFLASQSAEEPSAEEPAAGQPATQEGE
ncbi:MAG: ATP-binding cassette domain-containing protein [Polyangiaceae bacterium]|nr:ATP-binding cassette domain-containing protein [Polyangiaceae bacterium]